ncbi:hypothetical protein H310_11017 [Aphanomyces invadans]|uniref:Uncharacterized protein n=1 Tax=Aphanomyces invadans TaxID=157072 RepID=A0A024TN39_9STRA|nr:hypothetical protein H310_11017 [Aphanomyces invadans]ETV95580.1 hypothetical protein H310_11017 [Aphanomyces invadans]|eukprot:XP_008875773.1 hypothetical protein H310_11017 [Aphanomyces invadans]
MMCRKKRVRHKATTAQRAVRCSNRTRHTTPTHGIIETLDMASTQAILNAIDGLRREINGLRREIDGLRREMHQNISGLRQDIDGVDTRLGAVALLQVGSKADRESLHDDVAEICGELHHVHEKIDAVAAQHAVL